MTTDEISYAKALHRAQYQLLAEDENVLLFGLGVPGPTGIFGSTKGLQDAFGDDRVIDTPASENALTGIALGAATRGKRPILVHIRMDFAVLSLEPIANQAAKWSYMYGGRMKAPMVIRMIIGRGWGQGPQHSQSLQAWFGHIPGLKVVMPSRPIDAHGMLIAACWDDAPVIFIEHRWLYGLPGPVSTNSTPRPLEGAEIVRSGKDITIAATSYMVIEALHAADLLAEIGVEAEVIDLRCLTPIDKETLGASVRKTGHLLVSDTGHAPFGVTSEVISQATQVAWPDLKSAPEALTSPFVPTPTSPALADLYYPRAHDLAEAARRKLSITKNLPPEPPFDRPWRDQPDASFTGPY